MSGAGSAEGRWPIVPIVVIGGALALVAYELWRPRGDRVSAELSTDAEPRNAALTYRPLGATGEPYPDWVRALRGKSGVYVIRELQPDGAAITVYVGESHADRLYQTLTRHFQRWRRSKRFWVGQYGGQGHDPGLTYRRERVVVAARVLTPARALDEEARLIARLRPRDNLLGQPADEDAVPF
jgi:hypothetical protein